MGERDSGWVRGIVVGERDSGWVRGIMPGKREDLNNCSSLSDLIQKHDVSFHSFFFL